MTTEYSIQKIVSDGTLSTIALGIQYLQRNDIYMRIAGEETPQSGAPSGYTWSFLDNTTLKILPVVPNGVEVVVYRRTDVDAMYNIYSQNAQFDEATIDENNQQLLYIAQEYLEQGLPGTGIESLEYINTVSGVNYYRFKLTDGTYTVPFGVPDGTVVLRKELIQGSGSTLVGFEQAGVGSTVRNAQNKLREWVSVEDKGGVGDGVTDNATAFANAASVARCVKVGAGVFFSSVPPEAMLFSDRGGSVKLGAQTYKLSTVPQVISPYEQTEPDGVIVRLSNFQQGQDCAPDMANGPTSYANTLTGTSTGKGIVDNVTRLTGYGGYICKELTLGYSIDAFGTNSCEWMAYGDRITLVGANSGKNLGNANPVGRHEYFKPSAPNPNDWDTRWPEWRTFAGAADAPAQVMTAGDYANKATHLVGVGRNTFGFSITAKDSAALGYDAGTSVLYGQDNVFIGDRAGQWTIKCDFSTWGGSKAARTLMDSNQDSGWGYLAGANYVRMRRNTISGYQVMAGFQCNLTDYPESNCFYGRISAANAKGSIKYNCGYGENTLTFVQSDYNTANGSSALSNLNDPLKGNNTANGALAMTSMQDLSPCTSVQNSSGFGYQARVSGDNQVQLGNSATTTYVFGTVQNRSDERDKDLSGPGAGTIDKALAVRMVRELSAKFYRWDMRDDYFEEYQVQVGIDIETAEPIFETRIRQLPKDGSKVRSRLHAGYLAGDVEKLLAAVGVDFGFYQDHSVSGGCDVKTLGYDEFIPITSTAVAAAWDKLDELEDRIRKLEK